MRDFIRGGCTMIERLQIKEVMGEINLGVSNTSSDFLEKLDGKIRSVIKDACQRAKENGRKTVMGRDL